MLENEVFIGLIASALARLHLSIWIIYLAVIGFPFPLCTSDRMYHFDCQNPSMKCIPFSSHHVHNIAYMYKYKVIMLVYTSHFDYRLTLVDTHEKWPRGGSAVPRRVR